jgi:hypothetical protein
LPNGFELTEKSQRLTLENGGRLLSRTVIKAGCFCALSCPAPRPAALIKLSVSSGKDFEL